MDAFCFNGEYFCILRPNFNLDFSKSISGSINVLHPIYFLKRPIVQNYFMVDYSFTNLRGVSLHVGGYFPEDPTAIFLFFHGFAEHSGRYNKLREKLNTAGIGLVMPDHQGHGKSSGTRCDIRNFNDYVNDASQLLERIGTDYPDHDIHVGGHGMGANIALLLATNVDLSETISSIILSAPLLDLNSYIPKTIREMAKYVASVTPNVPVLKPDISLLSRNPDFITEYENDPLIYNYRLRARMTLNLIKACHLSNQAAEDIKKPILILQGTEDRVTNPDQVSVFMDAVSSEEKKLELLDGCYHELFMEPEQEQIVDMVQQWITEHTVFQHTPVELFNTN